MPKVSHNDNDNDNDNNDNLLLVLLHPLHVHVVYKTLSVDPVGNRWSESDEEDIMDSDTLVEVHVFMFDYSYLIIILN